MARLMEAGAFHNDPFMSARGAATVALSHLAGVGMDYLCRLRNRDWMPNGRAVVVLDPPFFFVERRAAIARTVAVPETAIVVIHRYRSVSGKRIDPDNFLLEKPPSLCGGGLAENTPLRLALTQACGRLGITPVLTFGEARALYGLALEAIDTGDGLYQYMTGVGRATAIRRRYTFETPPPDEVMTDVVQRALSLAKPWRRLYSGRGPCWKAP